jgi:hypothetical protein
VGGRCGPIDPECGAEGQPCCDGGDCEGALSCNASEVCVMPAAECEYTGCGECTEHAGCGYCGDGTCRAGDAAGPDVGSCAGWTWFPEDCGVGPDPCAIGASCGECASELGCGWCESTGTCESGDDTGPELGTCADWVSLPSECACSEVRGDCTSDDECCGDLTCRRGVTFGVRCCAEAAEACSAGADCCGYMNCVGGTCECRDAGRGCLEGGDCCSGTCTGGLCA